MSQQCTADRHNKSLVNFFHLYIRILNIVILCRVYAVELCLIVYSCCKKTIRVISNSKWNIHTASFVSQVTYVAFVPAK